MTRISVSRIWLALLYFYGSAYWIGRAADPDTGMLMTFGGLALGVSFLAAAVAHGLVWLVGLSQVYRRTT